MKKLRIVLITLAIFFFTACYEVNEEIVINANGSGTYVTKMDMSALIEMMQTFAGDSALSKEGFDKAVDTTIMMKNILDSSKDATAEQKQLLQDGKMNLKMNLKEKVFTVNMDFPFKSLSNLQTLMSGGGTGGMTDAFKNVFGKGENQKTELDAPKDPGFEQLNNVFDVTITNGLISKKVNQEKFKALSEKPELASMKSMTGTGMEILYTTTIKLPRPVKKSDNQLVKLSADKKTVTMKYNLLDMLENPEKFSYTIEY